MGGITRRTMVQVGPGEKCEAVSQKELKQKGLGVWLL
jgi:hypothetical protein